MSQVATGMSQRLERATHCYTARKECGCVVAVTVDTGDKETAKNVGEWIRDGLTIHRQTIEEFRNAPAGWFGCKCPKPPKPQSGPSLFA